jgi:hypothetical protein
MKKKTIKDSYGKLVEVKSFDEYWDEFHRIESLSMKERDNLSLKIKNNSYLIACTVCQAI